MATRAANKRLVREYKNISENPPPFIQAHPSEHNILEWHYLLTGPPNTPYHNGQYWGTLVFPPDYPYKPPAIRMLTPSGRFQTNTRLCLSISDFHPKSFNPAWEVSTILIGLLSFMTSEEMTTGSISVRENERKVLAARSRWWNSTGGGTCTDRNYNDLEDAGGGWKQHVSAGAWSGGASGVVKTGDGGERFRLEFPDVDLENWVWMRDRRVNLKSGIALAPEASSSNSKVTPSPIIQQPHQLQQQQQHHHEEVVGVRRRHGVAGAGPATSVAAGTAGAVVKEGESWLRRHKFLCAVVLLCGYVLLARLYE